MNEQYKDKLVVASILMTIGYALQAISDNKLDKSISKEANDKITEGITCLVHAAELLKMPVSENS